jgi:hypothetical protein
MKAKKLTALRVKDLKLSKSEWSQHLERIAKNTQDHLDFLYKQFKIATLKGYGGAIVKLDLTTDLFDIIESDERGYSAEAIMEMLKLEGFTFSEVEDFYDARKYKIVWDIKGDIDKSVIPMKH